MGKVIALSLYGLVLGLFSWLSAELFEYNLRCVFGKDVPWYLDVAGGLVINAINIPLAISCCIAQACGVPTPFIS